MSVDSITSSVGHGPGISSGSSTVRPAVVWVIIAWGVLLRLVPYLANRSLWLDEAMLALNIVERSFSGLLKPLDYNQGAPFGFLLLEKLAVRFFGNNEYALRFFPLLVGVLALLLLHRLAKRCLTSRAVPIAVALFSVSGPLIYYSSEAKQYSSDVAVALLLYLMALAWESHDATLGNAVKLGAIGAAALWFSHPAAFILGGIGACLIVFCLLSNQRQRMGKIAVICSLWFLSFTLLYVISLRGLSHNQLLLSMWNPCFVPSPLLSAETVKWALTMSFDGFLSAAGLELTGLAAFAFLVGGFSIFRENRERFFVLTSPIAFALLAAKIQEYPFCGRMLLFLVPVFMLFIAEGIESVRQKSSVISYLLIGLLFLGPSIFSTYQLLKPRSSLLPLGVEATLLAGGGHSREEIKPVLSYLMANKREGDTLYVFDATKPAFLYYAPKYGLNTMNYVLGAASGWTEDWKDYADDIDRLRGHPRTWLLLSHLRDRRRFLMYLLDTRGTRLDSFQDVGAELYLYDLSKPK